MLLGPAPRMVASESVGCLFRRGIVGCCMESTQGNSNFLLQENFDFEAASEASQYDISNGVSHGRSTVD